MRLAQPLDVVVELGDILDRAFIWAASALTITTEAAITARSVTSGALDLSLGISINDVTVMERNSGTVNATFTVSLSAASSLPVTVNYQTSNGTASSPGDYHALASTLLTFNPGETTRTITVVVNDDTEDETEETFFVNLSDDRPPSLREQRRDAVSCPRPFDSGRTPSS